MTVEVPWFRTAATYDRIRGDFESMLPRVMAGGAPSMVAALEAAVSERLGIAHCIAIGNGTDALRLVLEVLGIGPGAQVVVPAFTWISTASTVALAGAEPVFVDVDDETLTMSVSAARAAIGPRTQAIMPVHLFDRMADVAGLAAVGREAGAHLVEDSAQAIGMRSLGVHAGRFGIAGVLSFFPEKTLGAIGDAGMVCTDDDEVAAACRRLLVRPDDEPFPYAAACGGPMDDIHAAYLLCRLPYLDDEINRRAQLAAVYDERLAEHAPFVRPPVRRPDDPYDNGVRYVYSIRSSSRDALRDHLTEHGVGTRQFYLRPLTAQPCSAPLDGRLPSLPVAELACRESLALPLHPELTVADIHRVCDLVAEVAAHAPSPEVSGC